MAEHTRFVSVAEHTRFVSVAEQNDFNDINNKAGTVDSSIKCKSVKVEK